MLEMIVCCLSTMEILSNQESNKRRPTFFPISRLSTAQVDITKPDGKMTGMTSNRIWKQATVAYFTVPSNLRFWENGERNEKSQTRERVIWLTQTQYLRNASLMLRSFLPNRLRSYPH
jgi:hypothetical protein